jgi:hypothetical protein
MLGTWMLLLSIFCVLIEMPKTSIIALIVLVLIFRDVLIFLNNLDK